MKEDSAYDRMKILAARGEEIVRGARVAPKEDFSGVYFDRDKGKIIIRFVDRAKSLSFFMGGYYFRVVGRTGVSRYFLLRGKISEIAESGVAKRDGEFIIISDPVKFKNAINLTVLEISKEGNAQTLSLDIKDIKEMMPK